MDLPARNIQRGRDHGLPGWAWYRHLFTGDKITDWNDRPHDINKDRWRLLQDIYDDPRDIDLFVGNDICL